MTNKNLSITRRGPGEFKTRETIEKIIAGKQSRFRENVESILVAIVIALFIRTFVVQAFQIPSGSMEPTLKVGDHILVNKFIYGVKIPYTDSILLPVQSPKRNDIVVFKFPVDREKDFIKRVIGVPGDTVEIRNKVVFVNHERLKKDFGVYNHRTDYVRGIEPRRDNFGPITVPPECLFVMGDNRDNSYDSRFWGFVPLRDVVGKAFIMYWSWDNRYHIRWGRIGELLH